MSDRTIVRRQIAVTVFGYSRASSGIFVDPLGERKGVRAAAHPHMTIASQPGILYHGFAGER